MLQKLVLEETGRQTIHKRGADAARDYQGRAVNGGDAKHENGIQES